MDFALTEDQRMILDTVRGFVRTHLSPLETRVQEAEIAGDVFPDPATLKALQATARDLGLWALTEPEAHGGAALGALTAALVAMETSRSLVPFQYGGHVPHILLDARGDQVDRYLRPAMEGQRAFAFALSEPGAGSDATALRTTAVRDGDTWVINGQKTWITRGHEADFAIVFAVTDPEKGARGGVTAFLADRDAGFTSRPLPMMAHSDLNDGDPAELHFDDVRVPSGAILGDEGQGFRRAMQTIGGARLLAPARALGMAQRLLEMAVEYANMRISFGKPLADYQAIQWMLADSAVELEAAKWTVLHAAWKYDQGHDTRYEQSMAKLAGCQAACAVADRVLQIHGAMGYSKELPVERVLRQLRVYRIYEGADELQKINIARGLTQGQASIALWD